MAKTCPDKFHHSSPPGDSLFHAQGGWLKERRDREKNIKPDYQTRPAVIYPSAHLRRELLNYMLGQVGWKKEKMVRNAKNVLNEAVKLIERMR